MKTGVPLTRISLWSQDAADDEWLTRGMDPVGAAYHKGGADCERPADTVAGHVQNKDCRAMGIGYVDGACTGWSEMLTGIGNQNVGCAADFAETSGTGRATPLVSGKLC